MELFWNYWNYLEIFGITWKYLELLGNFWNYLEMFGITWKFFELLGNISNYLEIFRITWKYLELYFNPFMPVFPNLADILPCVEIIPTHENKYVKMSLSFLNF